MEKVKEIIEEQKKAIAGEVINYVLKKVQIKIKKIEKEKLDKQLEEGLAGVTTERKQMQRKGIRTDKNKKRGLKQITTGYAIISSTRNSCWCTFKLL